ncbi:MAG: sulfite dehydrogenase (quinone) subunit SoeA [Pseudomonadota bacterium]|nr:sulfite dehydrogenase (quinone) subunit SoeA [Pseudomonadota bacterium]
MDTQTNTITDKIEVKTTTCYMCACRCGIKVTLKNDEIRFIQGNPDHPLNQGILCAKGSSGIMKQYSPARLTQPMRRKHGTKRGDGDFEPISWEETFTILEQRLSKIRATDPKKFGLFTGRDQMQALTGLFAQQFGTPNYAAHGGFCSVNMAAGMIYSVGGSFWEFGGPDLEQAKLLIMIGTAEDHHSNPLKKELSKFKRHGGRFISVNPIRTGYSAIADEWVAVKPGTDGALLMALIHQLIKIDGFDYEYITRYTNAAELVNIDSASDWEGLFVHQSGKRDGADRLWWDSDQNCAVLNHTQTNKPALTGEFCTSDGIKVKPAFQLLVERVAQSTPEWAAAITGISATKIESLAAEMANIVKNGQIELPITWTDVWGIQHKSVKGTPIAFHSMRGTAAHSNGFQTIRALSILMILLGTIDAPGGFRHKAPYPKSIDYLPKPPKSTADFQPNTPLNGSPLGWPTSPEELFVDDSGNPLRLDKGFSWEYPLSVHGLLHNVITNAWRGDPYHLDTLLIFMSNLAWNSSMNTGEIRNMLQDQHPDGEYKIPFIVVCDAFSSEMVQFADLVLPDTTYLERHDVMSILDRPISEYDGPMDSVRVPILPPKGQCKPFQEVIVELAGRLNLPKFINADGSRKFKDYPDFVINYETEPGSGIGFLSGWRGADGKKSIKGEPNPNQWDMYANNNCFHHYAMPEEHHYLRNFNRNYQEWAVEVGFLPKVEPIMLSIYSEQLQHFRLAAQGKRTGRQPPDHLRERIKTYFDPLPFFYRPLEEAYTDLIKYPLNAVTQRPMAMYHSWDSQNAWLRQIHAHNFLYINQQTASKQGIADGDWIWVESMHGKVRCMCKLSQAVEPGTVWTWNAIGKAKGAWSLSKDSNESQKGFLLNHLIAEELPEQVSVQGNLERLSNSDPVTGQAGWYDVRVRIYKAGADEEQITSPQFIPAQDYPGMKKSRPKWLTYFAGKGDTNDR